MKSAISIRTFYLAIYGYRVYKKLISCYHFHNPHVDKTYNFYYKTEVFPIQNNQKNLYPSYRMNLFYFERSYLKAKFHKINLDVLGNSGNGPIKILETATSFENLKNSVLSEK